MQTLLIADDDPDLRLLLQTTLEDPAYRILEASDGESALHLVRQERPDVVILDRMMPKLDGLAVAQTVLADPAIRHIPLILLTALEPPTAIDVEPAPEVFAYLVKPFSPLQLLETVRQALDRTGTA
ncbi:MAG: response regulator [Nitrospira sp.]|nr:response regulator [Nitrospira sp.]MCY3954875.1 response regulator [Nitrospira sp.]MCY4131237.1 response regulator [Nitrospira sp.]